MVGNESPCLTMQAGGSLGCLMLPMDLRSSDSTRCWPTIFATNPGPGKQSITSAPALDFSSLRSMVTSEDITDNE